MADKSGFAGNQRSYGAIAPSATVPNVGFGVSQFSPTEFYNLSENITTNIYSISTNARELEATLKILGTPKDSRPLRDRVHVRQMSTKQIVHQTTEDLQRLTVVVRGGTKQQKLQVERLTSDFKDAVNGYSHIQIQVANRLKACLLETRAPSGTEESNEDTQQLLEEEEKRRLAQQQVQREMEFESGMLLEREERVRQIEGDIIDVNEIMRELSAMVHEQGEQINSIENNVESVHGHVEEGVVELRKAERYQFKRRKCVCYLLTFFLIFGIILTIVLVTQLKS